MLSAFREASEVFNRRFFFNALLPVAVVVPLTLTGVLYCFDSLGPVLTSIGALSVIAQALILLATLAVLWLLAGIVASQWRAITRIFEGYPLLEYWPFARFGIACPGVAWHARRQLAFRSQPDRLYSEYCRPHADRPDVLPTRLGNILHSAERYPVERYGIDPILLWPRLYPLLPDQFRDDYGEFVEAYEFSVVLCSLVGAGTTIVAGAELATAQPPLTFAATAIVGWLLCLALYRAACSSARLYAEQLRTAFDVYRDRLVELFPAIATVHDDREKFKTIQALIIFGDPAAKDYVFQED